MLFRREQAAKYRMPLNRKRQSIRSIFQNFQNASPHPKGPSFNAD